MQNLKQDIIDNGQRINVDCYVQKGMASSFVSPCKHFFFCYEIL